MDKHTVLDIGQWVSQYRNYTPIVLGILLIFFADPTPFSATIGLLLILCGAACRIYARSFIGTDSMKAFAESGEKLCTSGPFRLMRYPIYTGNFFIVMGFAVYGSSLIFMAIAAAVYAAHNFFLSRYEEEILRQTYGTSYEQYSMVTPRWYPSSSDMGHLFALEAPTNFLAALLDEKPLLIGLSVFLIVVALFT
jgi:protein-S-isoprenylcysteine O-methyltransferase Ste14